MPIAISIWCTNQKSPVYHNWKNKQERTEKVEIKHSILQVQPSTSTQMSLLISLFLEYSVWWVRPPYCEGDPVVCRDAFVRPRSYQDRHPRSPRPKSKMRHRRWRVLQDQPRDKISLVRYRNVPQ